MGIVIRRVELDAQLLDDARGDGVVVVDGEGVKSIARANKHFTLATTEGRTITTRLIAACDGAGSTTRKLLGIREPERKGHLYVLETAARPTDTGVDRGLIDFDLSVLDDGLQGYYWDFPTPIGGTTHVSRGIYHANLAPRRDVKEVLGRSLAKRGIDITQVKLKPFSTRPFVRGSTTWIRGVVLVGEAAGIDHTTGEGIAQAIEMGGFAARDLAGALRERRDTFYAYAREVFSSTVGRHFLQSAWLARRVYGRFGGPARRYLLRSEYARQAAMRWYRGERLSAFTQLRLGLGLAANAF
jgi:flavin-dependent dehydrogenase